MTLEQVSYKNLEFCPKCGDFYEQRNFVDHSGWCIECTAAFEGKKVHTCVQCGRTWISVEAIRSKCSTCREKDKPSRLRKLRKKARVGCASCGVVMMSSRSDRMFCDRPECHRFRKRYDYHLSKTVPKELPFEERKRLALEKACHKKQ